MTSIDLLTLVLDYTTSSLKPMMYYLDCKRPEDTLAAEHLPETDVFFYKLKIGPFGFSCIDFFNGQYSSIINKFNFIATYI